MDKRTKIIRAARRIIRKSGAAHLTLEEIADEAGVSKGGLLYHFPSKEALIRELIDLRFRRLTERIDEISAEKRENGKPGSWLTAFIAASLETAGSDSTGYDELLAAKSLHPELLKSARKHIRQWQTAVKADSEDPVLASILMLAADGILLRDVLGVDVPDKNDRKTIRDRLIILAEETGSAPQ